MAGLWISKDPEVARLHNRVVISPTATIAMEDVEKALGSAVSGLSDQNYTKTLEFYRFWIDIGQTYHRISPDHIIDSIWNNRATGSIVPRYGQLIHSSAHLILRLASDAESDGILAPYSSGLQDRLSSRTLRSFFANNLNSARSESTSVDYLYAEANLIAHWANLGYVEEAAMRHHVLQSLISHTKFHDHQADALIILFKLAGATFEAYADPSVVDRCFELLKSHSYCPPYNQRDERYNNPFCPDYREGARPDHDNNNYFRVRRELVQMRAPGKTVKGDYWTKTSFLQQRSPTSNPSIPSTRISRSL